MKPLDLLLGRTLSTREEEEQKIGVAAGIPLLGLDGLASAAYGPEAALTVLIPLGVAGLTYGLPIIGIIVFLLFILYVSYRQTMEAYPGGGGSYTVAKENLGLKTGLLAAAALLLDYVLVVAVGISAGAGALVSAFPALNGQLVPICLAILALIVLVNLRGVKESGFAFLLPTWIFLGGMILLIGIGFFRAATGGGAPAPVVPPVPLPSPTATVGLSLLMLAFASGCTAMTGVEAVSNGMNAFAEPRVKNAQRTLTWIVGILAVLLLCLVALAKMYNVGAATPGSPEYQSVISQLAGAVLGRGVLYFVIIAGTLAVLALSANTGFADFPRLCRLLAQDDHLPHAFAHRGRRLVYSRGIIVLALLSAALLIAFRGITDRLIPLFALGAFLAFTLSQAGMVAHWKKAGNAPGKLAINGFGALCTGVAFVVILVAKFHEGAWITLLLLPVLLVLFLSVRRHYDHVRRETANPGPVDVTEHAPLVVVPIKGYDLIAQKALEFALALSPNVQGLHVALEDEDTSEIQAAWRQNVVLPMEAAGRVAPRLMVVQSPFRRLFHPLRRHLRLLLAEDPHRRIAVVVPELVETKWWQFLLHNQRATSLKAAFLLSGERRIAVVNVPWYLGDPVDRPRSIAGP